MKKSIFNTFEMIIGTLLLLTACGMKNNWDLANENKELLRISTIFTAKDAGCCEVLASHLLDL